MQKAKNRLLVITSAVWLVLSVGFSVYAWPNEQSAATLTNNIALTEGRDFAAGTFSGIKLNADGCIVLDKGNVGTYVSPVFESAPFTELVMSWNTDTPPKTEIIVEAQVRIAGKWSAWFSWGEWNTWGEPGSSKRQINSTAAQMDIDTLSVKDGKFATALRYRIILKTDHADVTPVVRLIAAAVNAQQVAKLTKQDKKDIVIAATQYAQRMRDPSIAGKICSPISITTLLNFYGIDIIPEETAWNVMDFSQDKFAFGNWSFNCAYAGSLGLKSYVAYYNSLDDIRRDLNEGRPVAASVMYKNSETVTDDLPVLHDAPVEATDGHLVVVRGIVQQEGKEYVVVNDSAAGTNEAVKRLYLAEEFEKAWTKLVYVVKKVPNVNPFRLKRIPVKFKTAAGGKVILASAGNIIELDAKNIGSIVKLNSGKTEFVQIEGISEQLSERATGRLLIVTKSHQVYEVIID